MPSEYEVERLVFRMVGEDSSYARMMRDNTKANENLTKAIDQNTQAQKKADEANKKASSGWYEYARAISPVVNLYDKQVAVIGKVKETAYTAAGAIKTLSTETSKLIKEEASIAAFGEGKNIFSQLDTATKAETWERGIKSAFDNYRDVTRHRIIDEGDYTRSLTKYEYEREQLMKHEIERGKDFAKQERDRQRDLAAHNRGRIDDPVKQRAAIEKNLKEEIETENQLRAQAFATKGVHGEQTIRAKYEELDSQYIRKAWSATWAEITGGVDKHNQKLEETKKLLNETTDRFHEQERVRREAEKELENFDRMRKERIEDLTRAPRHGAGTGAQNLAALMGDLGATPMEGQIAEMVRQEKEEIARQQSLIDSTEDLNRSLKDKADMYGLVGEQAREAQLREMGQSELADQLVEQLTRLRQLEHEDTISNMNRAAGNIFHQGGPAGAFSPEQRGIQQRNRDRLNRDIKMREDMHRQGFDDNQINEKLGAQHQLDVGQDQAKARGHLESFLDTLKKQTEGWRENRTAMEENIETIRKMIDLSDEEKKAAIDVVETNNKARIAREKEDDYNRNLARDVDKAYNIREAIKSKAERKADRLKELDRLHTNAGDDGIPLLSDDEYAKAVKKLNEEFADKNNNRSAGPINAARAGSAEAASRYEEFLESFNRPGDFGPSTPSRSGTKRRARSTKKQRDQEAAEMGHLGLAGGGGEPAVEVDVLRDIAKDISRIAQSNDTIAQNDTAVQIAAAGFK